MDKDYNISEIRTELNRLIFLFCAGELSFSETKKKIDQTIDNEFFDVSQTRRLDYKEVISFSELKTNAYHRLERKQRTINDLIDKIRIIREGKKKKEDKKKKESKKKKEDKKKKDKNL